jgi:hypothetical protein
VFQEPAASDDSSAVLMPMIRKQLLLRGASVGSALVSLYALLAMLTSAMLRPPCPFFDFADNAGRYVIPHTVPVPGECCTHAPSERAGSLVIPVGRYPARSQRALSD